MSCAVRWEKGGTATVLDLQGDAITLMSSLSSPPGSRLSGELPSRTSVLIKIHHCKRQPEVAGQAPSFQLQGRVINATKRMRDEMTGKLDAPAAAAAAGESSESPGESSPS